MLTLCCAQPRLLVCARLTLCSTLRSHSSSLPHLNTSLFLFDTTDRWKCLHSASRHTVDFIHPDHSFPPQLQHRYLVFQAVELNTDSHPVSMSFLRLRTGPRYGENGLVMYCQT